MGSRSTVLSGPHSSGAGRPPLTAAVDCEDHTRGCRAPRHHQPCAKTAVAAPPCGDGRTFRARGAAFKVRCNGRIHVQKKKALWSKGES
ncbi:hypothetical protein MRX96_007543 [Rhipicephalus microplus]